MKRCSGENTRASLRVVEYRVMGKDYWRSHNLHGVEEANREDKVLREAVEAKVVNIDGHNMLSSCISLFSKEMTSSAA